MSKKLFLQTVVVGLVLALRIASSQGDPPPQGSIVGWGSYEVDPDASGEVPYTPSGEVGQIAGDDTCETIGGLTVTFQFSNRFRGNLYRIAESGVFLHEVKMQLAFAGTADFWISAYQRQSDGSYVEVDINGASLEQGYMFIGNAQGLGANSAAYYGSGPINNGQGIGLTPGDYAIGFAWAGEAIKYGRDSSSYPKPMIVGSTLASVSRDVFDGEPPLPSTLPGLTEFPGGAYSMKLCFEPAAPLGVCCDTNGNDQGCTDNVNQAMCTGPDKVWNEGDQCADQECHCISDCSGATCGDDGCEGSCGTCDDGNLCNGIETCNVSRTCDAGTPLPCNDGNACNGQETCNPSSGCVAGAPVNCDDGVDCTADACSEPTGTCTHDNADCAIPTVSEWGLVVVVLLLLTCAKVVFSRCRSGRLIA